MRVITLCGSTRFKDEFLEAAKWLTLGGWIVLMPMVFGHKEPDGPVKELIEHQEEMLDKLHFEKIDMSSCILVIDVNEYIGSNTKKEISYAENKGMPVYYYSDPEIIEALIMVN